MENKLIVPVIGGKLIATPSTDPNYPGIDIEFIADKENPNDISNPRVLIEQITEDTNKHTIRALLWNNPSQEDYSHKIELCKQFPDFCIREDLCDDTMIGIEDTNHQLYEYHTDDDEVVIFNRYEEDPGEVITDEKAKQVRLFALQSMIQQPHRWKSPVDYKFRCADCAALIEENHTWVCDECQKPCKEVMSCPEGLANPILAPDTLLNQELNPPQIRQSTPDPDRLAEICHARDILCNFCENDNCEKCQVTNLVNDAFCEFGEDDNT